MAEAVPHTCEPPKWLNKEFLKIALKKSFRRGSLEFNDFNISPATNQGDNNLSEIFRVTATVTSRLKDSESTSFLIKSLPKGEKAEKFMHEMKFFEKETAMFLETLPLLEKELQNIKGVPKLFADMYYQQGPPEDLIILEDLKRLGYQMVNRFEGLDLRHCIIVVESIAILHAASLKAIQRQPKIKEEYQWGYWTGDNACQSRNWVEEGVEALASAVECWKEFPAELGRKLRRLKTLMPKKLYDATELNENSFNVLTHGDLWTNNILFKYENGAPVGLKFVDFQLVNYNSAVHDLLYFIFTSPQENVINDHIDFILASYHRKLSDICKMINYPLNYSLGDLRSDFFEKLGYGFVAAITILPLVVAPCQEYTALDDMVSDKGVTVNADNFHTERFAHLMKAMLPIFIRHGVFD